MKTGFSLVVVAMSIGVGMLMFPGCTKKITKVEPVIEAAPVPEPSPAPAPAPVPVDSTAIIQAMLREAL